jgi:hypothetical protein
VVIVVEGDLGSALAWVHLFRLVTKLDASEIAIEKGTSVWVI